MAAFTRKSISYQTIPNIEVTYVDMTSTLFPSPRIPPARVWEIADFQVHADSIFLNSFSQNVFLETHAHRYTGSLGNLTSSSK